MTALRGDRDLHALGAHGTVRDAAEIAVKAVEGLNPPAVVRYDLLGALQVAESLLAGIHHKEIAIALRRDAVLRHVMQRQQHGHHIGGIVADAGAAQLIPVDTQRQCLRVRENHIRMGHEHHQRLILGDAVGHHHIQCLVDFRLQSPALQQGLQKLRPLLLVIRGGRNLRQGQQQLVIFLLVTFNVFQCLLFQHI